jgi:transcriptional regulator with XRE-family HTH domain
VNPSAKIRRTTPEWLTEIGTALRQRRIRANLTQEELARRSDVGLSALKHLESGTGANLTSLVKVVRALGCEDWLAALTPPPEPAVSPMQLLRARQHRTGVRQRVRPPRRAEH